MTGSRRIGRNTAAVVVAWVVLSVTGCAGVRKSAVTYHDPNMDFSLIQSVAVLPFDNFTSDNNAPERVRDVLMTMLQATGAVYVLPPGEVGRGIRRVGMGDPTVPTAEEATSLARLLEVDVLLTGTVREYGQVRSSSATSNLVSLSVTMIEGQTGRKVWSASSTRGGIGFDERLLGGGGRPMDLVTSEAVDDLLDKLFR